MTAKKLHCSIWLSRLLEHVQLSVVSILNFPEPTQRNGLNRLSCLSVIIEDSYA